MSTPFTSSNAGSVAPTSPHPLVKTAGTALYQQVVTDLVRRMESNQLEAGSKLPSEAELARDYQVNRLTVRRALADLARAGSVRTEHGVGSFVQGPVVRHRIDDGHASLSESLASQGLTVVHEVIEVDRTGDTPNPPPFPRWAGPIARFRFRRIVENVPWSLSEVTLPLEIAPLDWDGSVSLFAEMSRLSGIHVRRTERTFSAAAASPEDSRWLDVAIGTPILIVEGTNTDADGAPLAHIQHRTRSDRAEYAVKLVQ